MTISITNIYKAGTPVIVAWTVQDMTQVGNPLVDPSAITFKYTVNGGAALTLTYPGGGITHVSTGNFSVTLDTTGLPGTWAWSTISTGVEASDDGVFYVEAITP